MGATSLTHDGTYLYIGGSVNIVTETENDPETEASSSSRFLSIVSDTLEGLTPGS